MRRILATCLAASALLTACGSDNAHDPLQVTDTLVAATPAPSPPPHRAPAGTVLPAPPTQHAVFHAAAHTLATSNGPTLTLIDTRASQKPPATLTLPSTPASLSPSDTPETILAALPDSGHVAKINLRDPGVHPIPVAGAPVDATDSGGHLVVALRDSKNIAFLDNHGKPVRTTGPFEGPARLLPQGADIHVLDRLATSITPVEHNTGEKGAGLRAGEGATNAVTDRYGRILAVDTRGGELLAFATNPLIMKQRYPVPGGPFGIAYDPTRDLAWVTLTERNEIVAYDIAGEQPEERYRFPTVRQPNAVAVNPGDGRVFVASATGAGIQVVRV